MKNKKILIYGTGAVGGYFGLKLTDAGFDITFGCRSNSYKILSTDGLILDSSDTGLTYYSNIKTLNTENIDFEKFNNYFDIILFCVKSYDTQTNTGIIAKLLNKTGFVVSMQNGVENEEMLAQKIDKSNIIGAVVFIASAIENINVIKYTCGCKLIFGRYFQELNEEKIILLKNILEVSKLNYEISNDIKKSLWTKLIWNASFNTVSVAINAVVMDMIESEYACYLLRQTMLEVIQTAEAQGIIIDASIIDKNLDKKTNIGEFKTSMLQDFEKRRKLELDFLNGAVIRAAEKYNVAVPVNRLLINIVAFKDAANRK